MNTKKSIFPETTKQNKFQGKFGNMKSIPVHLSKLSIMSITTPRAEIRRTRSKMQPFRTVFIAKNGEDIGGSKETLTTRINSEKNILAHLNAFGGKEILVIDYTKGGAKYLLLASGEKVPYLQTESL